MTLSSGIVDANSNRSLTSNQSLQSSDLGVSLFNNQSSINHVSKINTPTDYVIKDIKKYTLLFNINQTFKSVLINTTRNGDIAYFMVNNTSPTYDVIISFLDSQNNNLSINYFNLHSNSNNIAGMLTFTDSLNRYLTFNSTSIPNNKTFSLDLTLFFPQSGYNFANAFNVLTNQSSINYQALFPYETLYFKVSLQSNRRVEVVINQNQNLLINLSSIRFYQWDVITSSPNVIADKANHVVGSSSFTYSWVSETGSNDFYIEINLNQGFTGNLSLGFSFQKTGYSFDTAIPLATNKTYTYNQAYRDRYSQSIFFSFQVNQTDINVNLYIKELDTLVIANSQFAIYHGNKFLYRYDVSYLFSNSLGLVNKSFTSDGIGIYYIEWVPSTFPQKGSFTINVSEVKLPVFIWSFEFIITDIFYFIVLPGIILYIFFKNNKEAIEEWELNKNSHDVFKVMSKNPRFSPKMEVPFQKILLMRKNIFIRDIIIDIVPVQYEADEGLQNSQNQTSLALRFKKIIDIDFSILIIVWLLLFWFINVILFSINRTSLFPFRVADLSGVNNYLFYITFPLMLVLLIIYFYNESYLKSLSNEIEYSIRESITDQGSTLNKNFGIDNENILKNLAYVRVLWNQAVKAFNEKNYSLFVIRADNAIKKLIETRFVQLIGTIDEKLDFNEIIELIRNQGFDVPSTKKIEYFRKIRNKVVHSSHMMDEKTAIETFTYYSKFLGRLGLRT